MQRKHWEATRMSMKHGDKFNAYTKQFGNLVIGAPFVCTSVDPDNYTVNAKDVDGNERKFWTRILHYPEGTWQDWTVLFRIL